MIGYKQSPMFNDSAIAALIQSSFKMSRAMKISGTLLLVTAVTAFSRNSIDNEIIGEPTVNCEDSLVGLTFDTKKPFSGRVYVYGMAGDENCSRAFVEKRNQSRIATTFKNGDCTMQRQRVSGKVQGFISSIVVVVSFHGTFVTKADRAFKCICYFRSQKTLRNVIEMSPIGTTELLNTMPTPVCTYTIHSQSADGPILMMGAVGEKVYHVWKCDSMATRFLLHSCSVGDGRGDKVDLIDVDGCAVDPAIQPDVHYDDSNRAVVEVSGYKFSDATVLNYECVLELCRSDAECDRVGKDYMITDNLPIGVLLSATSTQAVYICCYSI
ncbi:unnamed protein product [Nippostrongylus brasiliensis]|uniref:ZP domain-containing protein n=1 Tax=Nippostrongylus brasiliensis TaxID=27835 RepID=A0A0N4Y095_NIPBR|nr:unnamed protein product [Nippostrongylus brasiliensis]